MKGKRTEIEFENHEVVVIQHEGVLIHRLKKPNTNVDSIAFINAQGILAVTGDYGNWIFCREFHPTSTDNVSGQYWEQKLKIASTQEPYEFDEEGTAEDIRSLLTQEEGLTTEEIAYLNECLERVKFDEFDYLHFAHRSSCGRFQDHEFVPHRKKTKYWLNAVFDGFDEICRRMKEEELKNKS